MNEYLMIDRIGPLGGAGWLIQSRHSAVLVDTGFPYYGKAMATELRTRLNGLPLTDILITHGHYDHVGGVPKIKALFPDAIVSAAAYTQKILEREGAIRVMRKLNKTAAEEAGMPDTDDINIGDYKIDRIVADKDRIRTIDFDIEVWETPGHTADSLSFWLQNESVLALSETTGLFSESLDYVEPAFIVSWKGAIRALDRIGELMPQTLIIPHAGLLEGDDVALFLRKQREEILFAKELVFRFTDEGKPEEDILSAFLSHYNDRRPRYFQRSQPVDAFLINFKAMIPRTLQKGR